jgi:hypothetical protein
MTINCLQKSFLLFVSFSAMPVWANGSTSEDLKGNCSIEIVQGASVDWRGLRGRGYEIFDPTPMYEAFELQVRHKGAACRYHVVLTPQGGDAALTGGSANKLEFDVIRGPGGSSVLSSTYSGTETSIISGEAPAGNWDTALQLFLAIPPRQMVRAGRYQGGAIARLFVEDKSGLSSPVSETTAFFSAYVPGQIRTQLNGQAPSGAVNLDFGDLRQLPSRSLELKFMTNAAVAISLSSANSGNLIHQSGQVVVPYSVRAGNVEVAMTGRTILPVSTSSSAEETVVPVVLTVGSVSGTLMAGLYQDTLTVTIATQ